MRLHHASSPRRGVILMVVLAMLTLFAIIGISFVMYASSEATSARIAKEAESISTSGGLGSGGGSGGGGGGSGSGIDMDPRLALSMFLGQLIYDCKDDSNGIQSVVRGHSLARNMYGYNYTVNAQGQIFPVGANGVPLNTVPYSGTGRLNYTDTAAGMNAAQRVNYIYTGNNQATNPERVGAWNPAAGPGPGNTTFVGGFNPPYTYPDLNNFFLAAVRADGTVVTPSFHRNWLFNPNNLLNDPTNPNWNPPTCFVLTPRPSPVVNPGFPYPSDPGGDVKNLIWAPGGNDSIWIDIGAPVMTAPDGTQYKMLVAPLIIDLDGRVNLNAAGNILGPGSTHVSNQGWGAWEINLSKILNGGQDYQQLFMGLTQGTTYTPGKYGANTKPSGGQAAGGGRPGHYYAPGDMNALNETNNNLPSSQPTPPVGAASPWASFLQGYQSGGVELQNHPSLYDVFRSPLTAMSPTGQPNDDRVFWPSDMDALLRPSVNPAPAGTPPPAIFKSDTGNGGLVTDLMRLCPNAFGRQNYNPRQRGLVTTISNDLAVPGSIPWWYTSPSNTFATGGNAAQTTQAPFITNPLPFPGFPPAPTAGTSPLTVNATQPSEFNQFSNLALAQAVLTSSGASTNFGRLNLNQQLPPFPHMGSGFVPPYGAPLVNYGQPYNMGAQNIQNQFNAAMQARQVLANDIYRRLLNLTGLPGNTAPGDPNLTAHRWLAQLAANIVDFIDEDDICTFFNFYSTNDGLQANQVGNTAGGDGAAPTGANPMYWIFGTELPRVVLNEVVLQTNAAAAPAAANGAQVQAWVELYNPMLAASPSTPNVQAYDFNRVPLYMGTAGAGGYSPYRISITDSLMTAGLQPNANVLGKPATTPPNAGPPATTGYPFETTDADFAALPPQIGGGGNQASPGAGNVSTAGVDPQSFFLVGPPTPVAAPFQDPFVPQNQNANGVPNNTPVVRTASMSATENFPNGANEPRTTGLTVCLRRLANPYLPYDGTPTDPTYNPYITVDYLTSVPVNQMVANMANAINSRGKTQPYAAFSQLAAAGATAVGPTSPVQDQGAPNAQTINNVNNTFGKQNSPLPVSGNYDWLVFLDRMPISPIELLHVPAYQPYQLTQQFMTGDDTKTATAFQHVAPWTGTATVNQALPIDPTQGPTGPSTLLYRLLDHFECGNRAGGVDSTAYTPGRIPGKININTIWDIEPFLALCDGNASLGSSQPGNNNPPAWDTVIQQIFNNMMQSRSPGVFSPPTTGPYANQLQVTPNDLPFYPLSVGHTAANDPQYTRGLSFQNTILRANPNNNQLLMFENPNNPPAVGANLGMHPYNRYQLLTKIFNNVTTRSNTFAVFLTTGFFTVTNANATPPTLGAEVGISDGSNIRHRMLAIVDRTNLATFSTPLLCGINAQTGTTPVTPTVLFDPNNPNPNPPSVTAGIMAGSGTNPNTGAPWQLAAGMQLTIEPGTDNEETFTVQVDANGRFVANILKQHPNPNLNNPRSSMVIVNRGNPGPWLSYDMGNDQLVVPFFVVIQ